MIEGSKELKTAGSSKVIATCPAPKNLGGSLVVGDIAKESTTFTQSDRTRAISKGALHLGLLLPSPLINPQSPTLMETRTRTR
jgi:hypothetical protein